MRWLFLLPILSLVGCQKVTGVELSLNRAARGEQVQATLTNMSAKGATVYVDGIQAPAEATGEYTLVFDVPDEVHGGPRTVRVTSGGSTATSTLIVLGEVEREEVLVLLERAGDLAELRASLAKYGYGLVEFAELGGLAGPCAGALARVDVMGGPLGEALAALEREGIALYVDPQGVGSVRTVDHLAAIGAGGAQSRFSGEGVIIAVLDTGVSPHEQLGDRLLRAEGYNFLDNNADSSDFFSDPDPRLLLANDGHGTPIAVLAAGETLGVAPSAQILPVRVCDENGLCLASNVIKGVCHALNKTEEAPQRLIINLSLGGDTPVEALRAILGYALERGSLVAAAAGNEGRGGPAHYPAAHPLPGLVAVAALELKCATFEDEQLAVGTEFGVGDAFTSGYATVSAEAFYFASGQAFNDGFARVEDERLSGGRGKDIQLSNISLSFDFGAIAGGLKLQFGEYGGNVNLTVNGERLILDNFAEASGRTLGGVNITASPSVGRLLLEGSVSSFAIGGQELWLDDVCLLETPASSWARAPFSTTGDYLDIAAPGAGLTSGAPAITPTAVPSTEYQSGYSGTSFATPLIAGALALWREAHPTMTAADVEANLKSVAQPFPFPPDEVGAGILNLSTAP